MELPSLNFPLSLNSVLQLAGSCHGKFCRSHHTHSHRRTDCVLLHDVRLGNYSSLHRSAFPSYQCSPRNLRPGFFRQHEAANLCLLAVFSGYLGQSLLIMNLQQRIATQSKPRQNAITWTALAPIASSYRLPHHHPRSTRGRLVSRSRSPGFHSDANPMTPPTSTSFSL